MGKSVSLFCCPDEFQNWEIADINIYYQNEDKKNQEATMTFENKSQLESYISKRNYPKDLQDELLQSMEQKSFRVRRRGRRNCTLHLPSRSQ